MKVLILGASGIVAQHMRLCVPAGITPIWMRKTPDLITQGCDLEKTIPNLDKIQPKVVVNLAGESNVDTVERDPDAYRRINVDVPAELAEACRHRSIKFIQISSQAVYGDTPDGDPVNEYGRQKREAEEVTLGHAGIVLRLTFILGIRPLPHVGRKNPLEAMLEGQSLQVADRFFSPLFAMDAAWLIWDAVLTAKLGEVREFGETITTSRWGIAQALDPSTKANPVSHDHFPGLAPRAKDTSFSGSTFLNRLNTLPHFVNQYRADDRSMELAMFFGIQWDVAKTKLLQGFGPLHNEVTADFNRASPRGDAKLLDWYRTTEAYIWELSAYHEDPGFNYAGMCQGIVTHLKNAGAQRVLCLGDGIGDLTLACHRAGIEGHYHDLLGSRTAEYAAFRFWRQTGQGISHCMTVDFQPAFGMERFDAVVSLDFLEHVVNVEEWVRAIYSALRPVGLFCAQNAFNCGSGEGGAIPMHLAVNDRFEKDWDPLLSAVGFTQVDHSNWYRKGAA